MEFLFGATIAVILFALIIALICLAINIFARWKLFQKAGYEGWESIIPFYSDYVLCDIVLGKGLYFLILLIPSVIAFFVKMSDSDGSALLDLAQLVSSIFAIILYYKLAGVFNKSTGFGVGLALLTPIFILILAFDSSAFYSGPSSRARVGMNAYGYGNAGGYGSAGNFGGGYNDYPTYGDNNAQSYPNDNGFNQQGFNGQQNYQDNGFQNNGFQNNGFQVPEQKSNPFETPGNDNYYGNNSNYSSYNNPQNDVNNNNGF